MGDFSIYDNIHLMYSIYTTPALILDSKPHGDNDTILTILTKEFGLLRAVANGLRKEASKLRFSLQIFSVSDISLVKGKSMWRVTNAKHVDSLVGDNNVVLEKVKLTILRLVHGEEVGDLYNIITNGLNVETADKEGLERILVLRILNELGYIEGKGLEIFLQDSSISEELITSSEEKKKEIVKVINKGFRVADM